MKNRAKSFTGYIKKYLKGICAGAAAVFLIFAVGSVVSGQDIEFDPGRIDTSFSSNNQGRSDMTGYDLSEEGRDREEINRDSDRKKDKDENSSFEENLQQDGEDIILPSGAEGSTGAADTIDAAVNQGGIDIGADNPQGVTEGQKPENEDKEKRPDTDGGKKPSGDNNQGEDADKNKVSVVVNGEKKEFASEDDALLWFAENAGKNDNEQFFEGFIKDENGNIVPSYTDKENFDGSSDGDISYGYTGDSGIFVVPSGMTVLDLDFASSEASKKINTIVISKTVTEIYTGSLGNSFSALEKFVVSPENPNFMSKDGVLYRKTEDGLILYMLPAAKKEIKEWPENVIAADANSCYASNAEKIEFPGTVRSIGDFAFLDSLTGEIVIPANTESIGNAVFGFKNTEEPHKITVNAERPPQVAGGTFRYMTSKENPTAEIIVPSSESDTVYAEYLVGWGSVLSDLYGAENVHKILKTEDGAQDRFEYYEENGTVFWRRIGAEAPFMAKDSLGVYKFDENGGKILCRCTAASAVVNLAGTGVTAISENAFDDCSGLVGIRIPEEITELPENIFANNKNLRAIISYADLPQAENLGAPEGCAVCVRPEALADYEAAWGGQVRKIFGTSETYSLLSSGVLLDKENTRILCVPQDIESFKIPSYIRTIYEEAFAGNTALTAVTVPQNVTSIGEAAFYGCTNLRTVTYQTAAAVPDSCFEGCTAMTAFNLSGSGNSIRNIGNRAFYGCSRLGNVLYYTFELNGTVYFYLGWLESIGDEAFCGCSSMTYAYLHSSVTSVGDRAFAESGLVQLYWYTAASVPYECFRDCTALGTIGFGGTAATNPSGFGASAFYGCSRFSELKVPAETKFVGAEAFGGRNGIPLKLVFAAEEPPLLGELGQADGLTIYVPDSGDAGDNIYAAYLNSWIEVLGDRWAEILKTEDGAENRVTPDLPEPPEITEPEAVLPEQNSGNDENPEDAEDENLPNDADDFDKEE